MYKLGVRGEFIHNVHTQEKHKQISLGQLGKLQGQSWGRGRALKAMSNLKEKGWTGDHNVK